MREIKFRGKTKKGEWVYGDLFHGMDGDSYIHIFDDYGQNVEVLPNTIGQYTGLGANGNEIYEGDILKVAFSNYVFGIVMYHSNGYFYILESQSFSMNLNESDHRPLGEMLKMSIDGIPCNFRIVGNIYDNPELIEK